MASYFGIPIRVRMELQSYGGSKIFFKVTPPIKSSMAKNLGLSVADDKINSYASYALTEVDLVELSRGGSKMPTSLNCLLAQKVFQSLQKMWP